MLEKNTKKPNYKITGNMVNILHNDCININEYNKLSVEFKNLSSSYKKLENNIIQTVNDYDDLYERNTFLEEENRRLKNQIDDLKIVNEKINCINNPINDDLLYIDYDIFDDLYYDLKKNNIYYEKYLGILDNIFVKYNISSLSELDALLSNILLNDKYININMVLDDLIIKSKLQNIEMNNLLNNYKYFDDNIVKILDIYSKLVNDNQDDSSDDINISKKYNKYCNNIKQKKIEEFKEYCKLGKDFIEDNINSKKDISKDDLESIKEIIQNSDITYGKKDEKINRFINQCKRYYILSQKIKNHGNIIKSKCKTYIRDINNQDFDNLLKLLDNNKN